MSRCLTTPRAEKLSDRGHLSPSTSVRRPPCARTAGDMQKLEHMLGCPVAGANLLDFLPAKEDQARWAILSVP